MSRCVLDPGDISASKYIITHVFCPLQLPSGDDHSTHDDCSLAGAVVTAARLYSEHIGQANTSQWHNISRMLENLYQSVQPGELDRAQTISQLTGMEVGDIIALHIRAQNAGVVFKKYENVTIFEVFELSPKAENVIDTEGKLLCSYPGPAIEISNSVFDGKDFRSELVNFLAHMNHDNLDAAAGTSPKEHSFPFKDTVHPRYITELLTSILRAIGHPVDITRISKRVGDDVVYNGGGELPWRRSALWLLIRVALQLTLDRSSLGHATYKEFMLFFMCSLVDETTCAELPNHLLQFMSAKISRRLWKLGAATPSWLTQYALQICSSLRSILDRRWDQVRAAQHLSPIWAPSRLDLEKDIQLSLPNSGDYLRNTLASHSISPPSTPFSPSHRPRGSLDDFLSSDGKFFEEAYRGEPHITLYDVERAVEQGIDAWVRRVKNCDEACVKLEMLADKYSSHALNSYANNPELLSVMLLTTIELWVALDKIAVKEIPILADYSPEIPTNLLENLLLCKATSLRRLRGAHEYLSHRHSRSRSQWSIFSVATTADSFAVRFFRKSSHLRRLRARIEAIAQREVDEKVDELRKMNHLYDRQQKAILNAQREGTRAETDRMSIRVHVWPLPASQVETEAIVFELGCPVSFDMWRTATLHLLVDLCSPSIKQRRGGSFDMRLSDHKNLASHLVKHSRSRISLCFSGTSQTHTSVPIPAKREQVCLKDRWTSLGFDMHTGIPVSEVLCHSDSRGHFTYKLHEGLYHSLQKYVDSTSHTSNEVIANQGDRHEDLFIREYMAFGHLRSGCLLQWFNVLRELRGRSLSFRRPEVHMLMAQAVSQAGQLENTEWTWHQDIQQPTFCYALLGELRDLVKDVEASWLERVTMDTISLLLRRLLASNTDQAVSLEALDLLRTVRKKVFSWIQELSARLNETPRDDDYRGTLRDTAAICRSTFDVDTSIIPDIFQTVEDTDMFFSSSILVNLHISSRGSLSTYSQILLDRDRRLSVSIEDVVTNALLNDSGDRGINLAVGGIWPDYHPGSKWSPLKHPDTRWFWCTTAPQGGQRPQAVHLNLVNGSLYIDGKPLGTWLPDEFRMHPLYKLIFGEQMLEVISGSLAGSDYCTRNPIFNHQVYFSLRNNDSDLIIQARPTTTGAGANPGFMELIPPEKLQGDIPSVLIDGYIHWLNISTSILEIRPLESLWQTSSENWKLNCNPDCYRMWNGNEYLADIRSQSWSMISSLLRPLGTPQDLIVSVSPTNQSNSSSRLSVILPRYDLSFYVNEDGDLQSRNIRSMIYDENQSIGALFGLVNRLVLRPKIDYVDSLELNTRRVPIPGSVSCQMDGHHVCVEITPYPSSLKRLMYQTYKVNTDLGCLTGNGSLTSKLYCAYLHALTSGCSADPLTQRSGTEEALSVLMSASHYSDVRISPRDAELLGLIASLCGHSQTWSPRQSKEEMEWNNIPAFVQNYELYVVSIAIKERYERARVFHESRSDPLFERFPVKDSHFLRRRAERARNLLPIGPGGKPSRENTDSLYIARDLLEMNAGECRAYTAAIAVERWKAISQIDIWSMVGSWSTMCRPVDIAFSLRYDRSWLDLDFPSTWLKMYNRLREMDESKCFRMLFSLPAMAYTTSKGSELAPLFIAFASDSRFRTEDPPCYGAYLVLDGCYPSYVTLRRYVADCAYPFERSPEFRNRDFTYYDEDYDKRGRRQGIYDQRRRLDANRMADDVTDAWPCETPPRCSLNSKLYNTEDLDSMVQRHFSSCFRNLKLYEHVTRVQTILDDLYSHASPFPDTPEPSYSFCPSQNAPSCIPWWITLGQLLARPAPRLLVHGRSQVHATDFEITSLLDSAPLRQLIVTVEANAINQLQRQYMSTLRNSVESFESSQASTQHTATQLPTIECLTEHYAECRASYIKALHVLQEHLGPENQREEAVKQAGQWPRITADTLFQCLASNSPISLSNDWKKSLITFALLALEAQRARRLLLLHLDNQHEELCKELQNQGCDGWDANEHPDWLLIQLQGNFLIRRVQAEVANEMISPRSGDNTAMQLNMGEGKTSVIVPIVAAALANSKQLVRVIVPKPLTVQTLLLLADRLGGLTERRIYYVPFSRSLEINDQTVASLREIMLECMQERGILVVQPDHILSLKLVSVEKQVQQAEDGQVAPKLLELQKWLRAHSRDILDESDDILDVRSQLVFTIGHQRHVDGLPERWTVIQQILNLVSEHAYSLRDLFPLGVEYEPGLPGSFPYLRILREDIGEQLISWIIQDVIDSRLPSVNFGRLRSDLRDAIRSFISCEEVPAEKSCLVKECFGPLWNALLLLRGLLANGIMLFALRERRWRVDYGLFPTRSKLAVPYRAKDVPAQKAEFGHPDVAIILTCLSYYYAGLDEEQLRLSFRVLFKLHDPSLDYDLWVRACPVVPKHLRTVVGINIESTAQWNKSLFPLFSRNPAAIDFYLSNVVFPREANQYPSKLSSSGWDLAEKKEHLLTGFSGTNDGQYLLPLHISQRDPDHQRSTNAKVLSYILRQENKSYMCMAHDNGKRRDTREFLQNLVSQKPEIRVLLDVGAQMLDLKNHELAKAWLETTPDASAAVYFNEDDELMVYTRDRSAQLLQSSPYAEQLDRCVVYLDDAHTRGTDIKFPKGFRAAVTLGPKLTKDRLAQGCMRMRRLGHGHSIMFFAPLDIDRQIRSVASKENDLSDAIDNADILHWAIRETWENIQRWAPHWVQQGMDHASRYVAWSGYCSDQLTSKELSDTWLQPEAKTLAELYEPHGSVNKITAMEASPDIYQRCIDIGVLSLCSVALDEEQERELIYEPIREPAVQRPSSALPMTHLVHPDVENFVETGIIQTGAHFRARTDAFSPAFETLQSTSAVTDEAYVWSSSVLTTIDFEQTVEATGKMDNYLRPVHWIISVKRGSSEVLVVLSPHEVNYLLPKIRRSDKVHLHLYTPRTSKSMKPCDDLALYSVPAFSDRWTPPSSLMDQLNVFAGQLYLRDFETYFRLCRFIRVYTKEMQGKEGIEVDRDGFIRVLPINRHQQELTGVLIPYTFSKSPLVSLRALTDLRNNGIDYTQSHMGKLLHGQLLSEDDFVG